MPDYRETTISGTSYVRCRLIEINNPYQGTPQVTFTEERINNIGGAIIRDQVTAPFTVQYDPQGMIPLYDPVTLEATGEVVPMSMLYGLLFSAYIHNAYLRDNPPVPPVVEPEVPPPDPVEQPPE